MKLDSWHSVSRIENILRRIVVQRLDLDSVEKWFKNWNQTPCHCGSRIIIRLRGIVVKGLEL